MSCSLEAGLRSSLAFSTEGAFSFEARLPGGFRPESPDLVLSGAFRDETSEAPAFFVLQLSVATLDVPLILVRASDGSGTAPNDLLIRL